MRIGFFDYLKDDEKLSRSLGKCPSDIDWGILDRVREKGFNVDYLALSKLPEKHSNYDYIILHPDVKLDIPFDKAKKESIIKLKGLLRHIKNKPTLIVSGGFAKINLLEKEIKKNKTLKYDVMFPEKIISFIKQYY